MSHWVVSVEARAWNWQQGCLAQWDPLAPDGRFYFNALDDDGILRGRLFDIGRGMVREFERPFSAISPDGRWAASINFSRVGRLRGIYEYGYFSAPSDETAGELPPELDGLHVVDLATGETRLVLSYSNLLAVHPNRAEEALRALWFNHTLFNPTSSRIAFFARSRNLSESAVICTHAGIVAGIKC